MRKAGTRAQIRRLRQDIQDNGAVAAPGDAGVGGGVGTHLALNMFFKLFECFQRAHITFIKITLNS